MSFVGTTARFAARFATRLASPPVRPHAVAAIVAFGLAAATAPLANAASFQSLYSFSGGTDGGSPLGRLVMDTSGILYGTTLSGGSGSGFDGIAAGTVFRFDPAAGVLTTLYSFGLAGATGSNPVAGLTFDPAGSLYGTTQTGGTSTACSYGCGVVFKLVPATQTLTVLHDFTGLGDGALPSARVIFGPQGALYGTTTRGGIQTGCNGCGTVFALNPHTKVLTTLHSFGATGDGVGPEGALVADPAGVLYGTASEAGPHGSGIVFSVDSATSAYAIRHAFDYHVDGAYPQSDLILKSGYLVGTTYAGGPSADSLSGTVFALNLASSALITLHSFVDSADGIFPAPGVTLDKNGLLYGTTNQGGGSGAGTVYSLKPSTEAFALVHDFAVSDGTQPAGGLIADATGALYGVTSGGGRGHGTIFKIVP